MHKIVLNVNTERCCVCSIECDHLDTWSFNGRPFCGSCKSHLNNFEYKKVVCESVSVDSDCTDISIDDIRMMYSKYMDKLKNFKRVYYGKSYFAIKLMFSDHARFLFPDGYDDIQNSSFRSKSLRDLFPDSYMETLVLFTFMGYRLSYSFFDSIFDSSEAVLLISKPLSSPKSISMDRYLSDLALWDDSTSELLRSILNYASSIDDLLNKKSCLANMTGLILH